MSRLARTTDFMVPKLRRVAEFMAAQGVTLAGNLFYGLLCVRLLPKPEYAKFAVVFATLGSLVVLLDIGISNSIVPLVGENIGGLQLIADYVASLRTLAHRIFAVMAPATMVVFPLIVLRQHWSAPVVAAMVAIVLFTAWFARVSSAYGVVLILRRDRPRWYRAQMISSLGTLTLLAVLWAAHWLNVWSAILLNVAGIVFIAQAYYFRARELLGVAGRSSEQKRKAIVRLILPNTPNVVFYAIQGQIPQMLVTLFGLTVAVADVGALSRLAQIFVILSQMNPILIEPYFARLPRARLKASYLGAAAALAAVSVGVIALGRFFPGMFLWVLGPQYSGLHDEVLLILIGSSLRYVSGTLWTIHASRRFVYWWNNLSVIGLTLVVQVVFLFQGHLGTVRSALLFNIVSAAASLLVNILCAIYGFIHGPRSIDQVGVELRGDLSVELAGNIAGEVSGEAAGAIDGEAND